MLCIATEGSWRALHFSAKMHSIFCGSGRVSHLWFGFGFGKFSLKMSNFSIFFPSDKKNLCRLDQKRSKSTWVKGGLASYLLYGSKVSLGWVRWVIFGLIAFLVRGNFFNF